MSEQPEALRLADELDVCEISATRMARAAAELRRLHEANEALRAELAENEGVINVWRGRTQRAEAEVEALRADAERYRWLKNHSMLGLTQFGQNWSLTVFEGVAPDALCEMDAAIDAARSKT